MRNFYDLNPNHHKTSEESSSRVLLDVNTPLENDEFARLFDEYCLNPSEVAQNNLGMHLNKMNYLLGILPDENNSDQSFITQIEVKKGDALRFLICSNDDREVFLPIFTKNAEVKAFYNEPIYTLSVSAVWLWQFILNQKNYSGVLINPSSIAWYINTLHIQSLLNDITEQP